MQSLASSRTPTWGLLSVSFAWRLSRANPDWSQRMKGEMRLLPVMAHANLFNLVQNEASAVERRPLATSAGGRREFSAYCEACARL